MDTSCVVGGNGKVSLGGVESKQMAGTMGVYMLLIGEVRGWGGGAERVRKKGIDG